MNDHAMDHGRPSPLTVDKWDAPHQHYRELVARESDALPGVYFIRDGSGKLAGSIAGDRLTLFGVGNLKLAEVFRK
jgi:hypothetical protein